MSGVTKKNEKPKEMELKNAYILSAEVGERLIDALGETPLRLSNLFGPLRQAVITAPRGNITVHETGTTRSEPETVKLEPDK